MKINYRKAYRLISVVLVIAVMAEAFMLITGSIGSPEKESPKADYSGNEQQIAADISNMTGVETQRILNIKASGKSWNEVLESLKNTGDSSLDAKSKRNMDLLESGLGEEAVASLVSMGFAEKDIMNAKLLGERAAFQIKQLVEEPISKAPTAPSQNISDPQAGDQETFLSELRPVAEQFDLESAVRLMLTLHTEFGSYEAVLDEYLLALQLGLSLEQYVQNKQQYLKDKEQKDIEKAGRVLITLNELERRALEKIQHENEAHREVSSATPNSPSSALTTKEAESNPLPEAPLPKVTDVKPANPADAINEELKRINPNDPIHG
jgi:hypothetical protein